MTGELASQFAPGPSIQDAGNITRGPFPQKQGEPKSSVAGLEKLLEDAEYLLDYAAESGIALEPEMVETIVAAEAAEKLSPEDTVKAIAAITSLSAKLQPVSAKTLRACQDDANRTVKKYRRIAIALGVFLLVSSIVSFMTSRLSTALDNDVATANELAITLNAIVMSPASATPEGAAAMNADTRNTTNLQQFLATIRDMQRVSLQLSVFVMGPKPTFGRRGS